MFTPRLLKLKIHSRRVFIFKRSLPVFAFLLASLMIAWPALKEQKDKFASVIPTKEETKNAQNDMEQVRFFSKDGNQNPFTVVAESVRETDASRQIVLMEKPKATYRMSNNSLLTGNTSYGMVFQQEKYLYFDEKVDLSTTDGYQGVSSKVVCEYESGTLGSDADVYIKGPAGMLKANGFFMKEHGDYLHFKGNTHTLLFNTEKPLKEIDSLKFSAQKDYFLQDKKNMYITSQDGIIIDQKTATITAQKEVEALQEENRLTAPKVALKYEKQNGETRVLKISAMQKAHLTRPQESATAETMVLYRDPKEIQYYLKKETTPRELQTSIDAEQMVTLSGNAFLKNKEGELSADIVYVLYDKTGQSLDKALAKGKVIMKQEKQVIKGNKVLLYKNPDDIKQSVSAFPAIEEIKPQPLPGQIIVVEGNASITETPNEVKADKIFALYDPAGDKIVKSVAIGHLTAQNGAQKIEGEYGVYNPSTKVISVYNKVLLHDKNSVLTGEKATLNLKTGISSLSAPANNSGSSGRVKGQLVPNDFKGK